MSTRRLTVLRWTERRCSQRLQVLQDLGLGYLTLGEETPSLSGGEAQRLKLASEMGKGQSMTACLSLTSRRLVCIRWTCRHCCRCFETLVQNGATVLVIEHDLDVMRNADYIIDMGPGGGEAGGQHRGRRNAGADPDECGECDRAVFVGGEYANYCRSDRYDRRGNEL